MSQCLLVVSPRCLPLVSPRCLPQVSPRCLPQEYRACNLESCPEVRRNTPWTPWIPVNVSQDGARLEQRSRYTCRALLPQPQLLQAGKRKTETRYCPNDGSGACQTDGANPPPPLQVLQYLELDYTKAGNPRDQAFYRTIMDDIFKKNDHNHDGLISAKEYNIYDHDEL
uniref:EF-hand domain-containing protein n=1 Tax=Knipowitschia caucasica TaxID=637954 RepID=A0AAV2JYY4_KNICA